MFVHIICSIYDAPVYDVERMSVLSYQLIKIHSLNALFWNKANTTIDRKVTHA